MTGRLKPLFSWRSAIAESDLAPTTRHVALALSIYMNERGGSAHPGPALLAKDTGLHISTVKEKLAELEERGWLVCISRGGLKGERRIANEYEAAVPIAHGDPSSRVTGSSEPGDPSPSPRRPVAHGDPNSPENSPENSGEQKRRGTRIPEDFELTAERERWAHNRCPGVDVVLQHERFVNHWRTTTRNATKLDWDVTWRNWMLEEFDRLPPSRKGTPVTAAQPGPVLVLPPSRVDTCPSCDSSLLACVCPKENVGG